MLYFVSKYKCSNRKKEKKNISQESDMNELYFKSQKEEKKSESLERWRHCEDVEKLLILNYVYVT